MTDAKIKEFEGQTANETDLRTRLLKILTYCPESGVLRWKLRGPEMFQSDRQMNFFNQSYGLKPAGVVYTDRSGKKYRLVKISGVSHRAHRLALLMTGQSIEGMQVDHIDGDGLNNKLENIRVVNRWENAQNCRVSARNRSGRVGVQWRNREQRWQANICANGKRVYLGQFADLDEAIAARAQAEADFGFHPNHGSFRPLGTANRLRNGGSDDEV